MCTTNKWKITENGDFQITISVPKPSNSEDLVSRLQELVPMLQKMISSLTQVENATWKEEFGLRRAILALEMKADIHIHSTQECFSGIEDLVFRRRTATDFGFPEFEDTISARNEN